MSSRDLRSSRLGHTTSLAEEGDAGGSLDNLMDVMLVFACGLLLALIANWNLNVSDSHVTVSSEDVVREVSSDELSQVHEAITEDSGDYTQVGMVYEDDTTGQLYVVTP